MHFGNHAFCFTDSLQARVAEGFLLGNGAEGVDLLLNVAGHQLPIAMDTPLQVNEVVRMADGPNALCDLLALLRQALADLVSSLDHWCGLLQTG
jgi:hypothetical protein